MLFKNSSQKLKYANSNNQINNHSNRGRRKIQNQLQNKSKYKNNNRCFSQISSASVLSLAVITVHLCVPRMPSYTGLLSGPAMGTAQTVMWSHFASKVHICQSYCFFFCGASHCPFIYSIDTEST